MNSNPEVETPKASFKDYFIYAAMGGIIHPIAGGAFSFLLAGLDALYANFVSKQLGLFTGSILMGITPLGIFVCVPMFIFAGAFYNIIFGLIYNATKHGKANSASNRILFSILFSLAMSVIGPIAVYIIMQIVSYYFS